MTFRGGKNGAIAIIGMALNVPGAENLDEFWNNLREGVESFGPLTDDELNEVGMDATARDNPDWVPVRGFPKNPKHFDAEFFGISRNDALLMDPQQRLLLECTQNAFDDAGQDPLVFDGDIGVFAGAGQSGYYSEFLQPAFRNQPQQNFNSIILNDFHYPATRLAHTFNCTGPAVNVSTACSTGLVAAHYACQALRGDECDMAVVGVSRINTGAWTGYPRLEGMIYSSDGHCRVFDSRADGTVFTNGAAVVILKRLDRAIEDGDNIRGMILGSAVNNDGNVKLSFTAPSVHGQEAVLEDAYLDAGIDPATVAYMEGHGTATLLGDPIEVQALTKVFRRRTDRKAFCHLGSVKANIGHLEVAAGIAGLIKAILTMEKQEIPGVLHFSTPNPTLNLDNSPFIVNSELCRWEADEPRRAGVSSFGIGGTNAHMVLEEGPATISAPSRRKRHILPISAKSLDSRERMVEALRTALSVNDKNIADVAYTLQTGRRAFPLRAAILTSTDENGQPSVETETITSEWAGNPDVGSIWMFPGQGSQYVGMARDLYEEEEVFRTVFDRCSDRLAQLIGTDLRSLIFDPETNPTSLEQTALTQPALFTVEIAMARLLEDWGIRPSAFIGHSIGEYVAACLAGVFSEEDALALVAARGALMQALPAGAMLSVNAPESALAGLIDGEICLAGVNSPEHCVLSGPFTAIEHVAEILAAKNIPTRKLHTSHAFHSSMMDPILEEFERLVARTPLSPPEIPFVSNLTGTWIEDSEATDPAYWSQHLRGTVRFAEGLSALCDFRPHDMLVEVGPSTTLSQLAGLHPVAQDHPTTALGRHSRDKSADSRVFIAGLATMWATGVPVGWENRYADEKRRRVSLPPYVFDRKEFFFSQTSNKQGVRRFNTHPFVGWRHKSAVPRKETVFDARISTYNPEFLLQHTLFTMPLVPASCYVDAALAVGRQMLGSENLLISDISFQKPIPLQRGYECQLQTVVTTLPDGSLEMRLFSLPLTDAVEGIREDEWQENAVARVSALPPPGVTDASVDLAAWQARITEPFEIKEHYESGRIGFHWGPAFQTVVSATSGEWEVLARISLPKSLEWQVRDFVFHPCLLDGVFQIFAKAIPLHQLPGLMIPAAIEKLFVHGAVPTEFWCYIKARPDGINEQGATGDMRLVADDGREFARIEGFWETVISQATLVEATARVGSWFHRFDWRSLPVPVGGSAGQLVLFADHGGLAQRLARKAIAIGWPAPTMIYQGNAPHISDPEDCETIIVAAGEEASLGEKLAHLNQSMSCGYFWGFDREEGMAVEACDDLVQVVKTMVANVLTPKNFVVVTRGTQQIGTEKVTNVDQGALWGLQRVVINEFPDLNASLFDLDAEESDLERDAATLLTFLDRSERSENQVCWRNGAMHGARLVHMERQHGITGGAFAVRLGGYGSLDSLTFEGIRPAKPRARQVTIAVEASSVNFRDVLQAMGAMRAFNEAAGIYDPADVPIGFECAGRIIEKGVAIDHLNVGDRVVAFGHGCHTSHFTVDVNQVVVVPDSVELTDAAALPTVLVTALYGLDHLAKLKKGDRVLIHSCAGGVGQAALSIARRAGATIFATASPSKWDFLRSQGVEHIWNSRTHDFVEGILAATDGEGVDVVLNALNGEFIAKTLSVLAKDARFIEIGKIGSWSPQQVAEARPDIAYHKFDLNEVNASLFRDILEQGLGLVAAGELCTVPTRKFPFRSIVDAFRWIAQGQSIGKAVLEMPQDTEGLIRANATYLITGGLGGLGIVMAGGLAESGARHLVLVGRNDAKPHAQAEIDRLRSEGVDITVFKGDVGVLTDTQALIAHIDANMPPLAGVLHAAGVLDDGMITKLDYNRLSKVMAPKVSGARNLDALTRGHKLDFFVLFSSISATLGAAGQGNYSAANAFMDSLAQARTAEGLPGLSIGWGAWAATGMAHELVERFRTQRASIGLKDIAPSEGVVALNNLLDRNISGHVVAMPVQWSKYLAQYARSGKMPALFTDLASALDLEADGDDTVSHEDISFVTQLKGANSDIREKLLTAFIAKQVAATVGTQASSINPDSTLSQVGVDSLLAMDLRTRIKRSLGVQVPLAALISSVTIVALANKLGESFASELNASI